MSVGQPSVLKARSTRSRQERVARNSEDLLHPNVAAFLKAIAAAEGGGYDFKYGALKGRRNDRWRFTDMSTHPGPGIDGKSTAAGMYQITRPTWEHHGGKLGLRDFSPRTQDLIAVEILRSLGGDRGDQGWGDCRCDAQSRAYLGGVTERTGAM